jgi:hypothetical protein
MKSSRLQSPKTCSIFTSNWRLRSLRSKARPRKVERKNSSTENYVANLASIKLANCLVLRILQKCNNISEYQEHPGFELLKKKASESIGTPSTAVIRKMFISWECLIDKMSKISSGIYIPKGFTRDDLFKTALVDEKKVAKDLSALKNAQNKDSGGYRLPASSYIDCLPRSNPKASNYKLVRYWEKNVIPKIEGFVRSSFSEWQMGDYFEQLRRSLRVMDHIYASEIAFKLCDWGLPNGCVLPEADYDWDTIDIEEIEVGSLISVKLEFRGVIISEKVSHLRNIGLDKIVGEVLLVEHQTKFVLVLIRDDNYMNSMTLWVPQQCVEAIQYSLDKQGASYPLAHLNSDFNKRYSEYQTYLAQIIFISTTTISKGLSQKIDTFTVLKWQIIKELNHDLISGWLEFEGRIQNEGKGDSLMSRLNKRERVRLNMVEQELFKFVKEEASINYLLDKLQEEAGRIVVLLNENNFMLNLKDKLDLDQGQAKNISPLNIFNLIGAPENSVCAIAITFDKKAYLGLTSGIKFFSDKKGSNMVNHIFNNQQETPLRNIPPILFKSNEIYFQFYFSIEGVPIWSRDQIQSDLSCVVHGIPYSWTPVCWLIDTLTSLLIKTDDMKFFPKINQLLKTAMKLSQEIKGPNIIKQMLYKLDTRMVRKIKYMIRSNQSDFEQKLNKLPEGSDYIKELYDIEPAYIESLLKDLEQLFELEKEGKTDKDEFPMFSSFTQDLVELLATLLSPITINNKQYKDSRPKPEYLERLINFIQVSQHFKLDADLSPEHIKEIQKKMSPSNQVNSFVVINNIPQIHKTELQEILVKSLKERQAKIFNKSLDIYLPVGDNEISSGSAVLFIEGWTIPENEEGLVVPPDVDEKPVEEPKEEEINEEDNKQFWQCDICTLQNEMESAMCAICEAPKPANPIIIGGMPPEGELPPPMELPKSEGEEFDALRIKVWFAHFKASLKEFIEKKNAEERKRIDDEHKKKKEELEARKKEAELKKKEKKNKEGESKEDNPGPIETLAEPVYKDIAYQVMDVKFGKEIVDMNEYIEAVLIRIMSDEFQKTLNRVLEEEYLKRKEELDTKFSVSNQEDFFVAIKECEPVQFIDNLASLGYDFWLDKVVEEATISKKFDEATLRDLIQMVEKDVCNESRFFSFFKGPNIRFIENSNLFKDHPESQVVNMEESFGFFKISGFESKYTRLLNLTLSDMRFLWEKLLMYNNLLFQVLPVVNLSKQCFPKMGDEILTLGGYITSLRYLSLSHIKSLVKTEIMSKTSLSRERTPQIKLERLAEESDVVSTGNEGKETGLQLWKNKAKFVFLNAFDQIKKIPLTLLRPEKMKGAGSFVAFEVVLQGENVQGEAGPYRQFFADISAELQPSSNNFKNRSLNMFIPSPNQSHKHGEDRHKFVINPSANSSFYLQLYETLGILMGCALRTNSHFTLDLPSIFWKRIVGEDITQYDLELVDKHFVEHLRNIESCTEQQFEQLGLDNFTIKLSDDTTTELLPRGTSTKVTFERRFEYIELALKTRIEESTRQTEAIIKGLTQIIPGPYLKCITNKDLEIHICGTKEVDFKLLKKNTIYSGGLKKDSELITNFWKVLEEMKEGDRLRFIKFCWGQERLPATEDDYTKTQTRFMIKPSMNTTADQKTMLPKADTCFFNLELPNYPSKEVMQERILLAINFDSDSLNAEIVVNEFGDDHGDRGDNDYE